MGRLLYCGHCEKRIEKWGSEEFDYGPEYEGPYCDRCWPIFKRLFDLEERVFELERLAASDDLL